MIHTEVDLPTDVYKDVERIAEARKRPTAQVIRDLIGSGVVNWRQQHIRPAGHGLGDLANLGIKGPSDFASRLDEYLYGPE